MQIPEEGHLTIAGMRLRAPAGIADSDSCRVAAGRKEPGHRVIGAAHSRILRRLGRRGDPLGRLSGLYVFVAGFFGMSSREACVADPFQPLQLKHFSGIIQAFFEWSSRIYRVRLETVWEVH